MAGQKLIGKVIEAGDMLIKVKLPYGGEDWFTNFSGVSLAIGDKVV